MANRRRSSGFTLIEVLAAFIILAMTLGAVFAAFSTGLTAQSRAERVAQATLLSRSVLAEIGVSRPLEEGSFEESYDDGEFVRVAIRRIDPYPAPAADAPQAVAYEVVVQAGRDGRVATELRTVRLKYEL